MRKRSLARQYAVQVLYTADINDKKGLDVFNSDLDIELIQDDEVIEFARRIVSVVDEHRDEIDKVIQKFASNWPLDRMGVVDRNILRLGTAELLYFDDIPPKVSINEAVEVAKAFGDADAYKFVNGVLDKIRKELCPTK